MARRRSKWSLFLFAAATWFRSFATAEQNCDVTAINATTIVTPGADDYDEARRQFASTLGSEALSDRMLAPVAVVYCTTEEDVQAVVAWAANCDGDYKLAIRSGGHQYAGYSSCTAGSSCIQVDVSGLKHFELREGTANVVTLGAGLVLSEVIELLLPFGLVIPMGICNSVGVGGHFQTSALGMFGRSFGLGLDWVLSFRIVTADGTIHDVSRDSDAALYNAVLGGAPGSFGIVLDYTIEAVQAVDHPNSAMFVFTWPYSRETFQAIAALYSETMAMTEIARDLFLLLAVFVPAGDRVAGITEPHVIGLYGLWTGIDSGPLPGENNETYIDPFRTVAGFPPLASVDTPAPIHIIQDTLRFDFNHSTNRYYQNTVASSLFPDEEYIGLMADLIDTFDAMPGVYVSFDYQSYGAYGNGSQYNRNVGLNGFPTRSIRNINDLWVYFHDEANADRIEEEIAGFLDRSSSTAYAQAVPDVERMWHSTQSIRADEADLSDPVLRDQYYPTVAFYEELVAVKMRVDPDDIFGSNMTVPLPKKDGEESSPPTDAPAASEVPMPTASPSSSGWPVALGWLPIVLGVLLGLLLQLS